MDNGALHFAIFQRLPVEQKRTHCIAVSSATLVIFSSRGTVDGLLAVDVRKNARFLSDFPAKTIKVAYSLDLLVYFIRAMPGCLECCSSNVLFMASTVMVPIGNVAFSLKVVPHHQDLKLSDTLGLAFILTGDRYNAANRRLWHRFTRCLYRYFILYLMVAKP